MDSLATTSYNFFDCIQICGQNISCLNVIKVSNSALISAFMKELEPDSLVAQDLPPVRLVKYILNRISRQFHWE
ncbi:protein MRG1-like [Iris pallida]|uniref:Protein MRG1-like n=1 Tax=Iris pallida TaxID=29817 RepID=A0AAX6H966_IRIPA|nr:protein MRG1-like [Iris pallida]